MPGRRVKGLTTPVREPPPHEPAEDNEDTEMGDTSEADQEGSNRANKRKSESPHKARPVPALESDTESVIEVAAGRRTRKPSQKVRDNQVAHEELQETSQSEVLAVLKELNRRVIAMEEKEEAYRARASELEEAHRGEVKKLEDLPSPALHQPEDVASVVQYFFVITRRAFSKDLAAVVPTGEQGLQGTSITLDLKSLDKEITLECDTTVKMRDRVEKALRSIRGLEQLEIRDFKMWHTSATVKVARVLVSKEEEGPIRQNASEWIPAHLKGARLIGPKWYSLKAGRHKGKFSAPNKE
ncbi:hypothetical protein B0A49_09878 [Cryomyces minteri]|uniref:Uncharacterized protein n=1 Tax=Cryomyces minteri TaxID=331657 RepID=A0A4U0XAE7_9PEZI|nr:hypothetical protein B0A49_09878 [Cryomyces minteri]